MGLRDLLGRMLGSGGQAAAGKAGASVPPAAVSGGSTDRPANRGRVLLIHGYSANGEDFKPWRDALAKALVATKTIEVGNYVTLNNEVTIKDLGEAFDRALRYTEWSSGGRDDTWTFDAVVHSTGMLVLRQWLTSDPYPAGDPRSRVARLKHLVGLAPATFGSPQAQQGRSWLGALVKGDKHLGPDFLNAGNQVLDGLELASRYTWDLAHRDMLCSKPFYDSGANTPYATVLIGNQPYDGIAAVSNSPGCDGTVRWAGCALNTRKVSVDFRREPKLKDESGAPTRYNITPWVVGRLAAPMIAVGGKNHGTLLSHPEDATVNLVSEFLQVADDAAYQAWESRALAFGQDALKKMDAESQHGAYGGAGWQQIIVHMVDDHGDGVKDFNLQLYVGDDLKQSDDPAFPPVPMVVNTYSEDGSYRSFYVRLSNEMLSLNSGPDNTRKMWLEVIASSGSALIEYEAYTTTDGPPQRLTIDHAGGEPVKMDLTGLAQGNETLLYPYTTTLLEIFVEREPLPLNAVSTVFGFLPEQNG